MATLDRVTLKRDLTDCRGNVLGRAGLSISVESVEVVAHGAPSQTRRAVGETPIARDLQMAMLDPTHRYMMRGSAVQAAVARALLSIQLPPTLIDELRALQAQDPERYQHALHTAVVTVRMLIAAVGEARALPGIAAAALLHDIGFRHIAPELTHNTRTLGPDQVAEVASHSLLGAYHLACVLGNHAAVQVALYHHWRCGHGYPRIDRAPSRAAQVVAVASTFAALIKPRHFRPEPYDSRGALDLLVTQSRFGTADVGSVRLLAHALRGARGDLRELKFASERPGHAPIFNKYTPIALEEPIAEAG